VGACECGCVRLFVCIVCFARLRDCDFASHFVFSVFRNLCDVCICV